MSDPLSTRHPPMISKDRYQTRLLVMALLLALLLSIPVSYLGTVMIRATRLRTYTSKPPEPNAYLDKALLLHDSHVAQFHKSFLSWARSPEHYNSVARILELIEEAHFLQMKLSKSEDDGYRNYLALRQIHFALVEKKTHDEVIEAIERYIKSINVDRVLVMEKFLAEYLASPQEGAGDRLNGSLVPFDLKIAQLKEVVPSEYHQFTDRYWKDLKRSTIPGLKEPCLPQNDDISSLVERYKFVIDVGVNQCVPSAEDPFENWWGLLVLMAVAMCIYGGLTWIMYSLSRYCLSMYLFSKASETKDLVFPKEVTRIGPLHFESLSILPLLGFPLLIFANLFAFYLGENTPLP